MMMMMMTTTTTTMRVTTRVVLKKSSPSSSSSTTRLQQRVVASPRALLFSTAAPTTTIAGPWIDGDGRLCNFTDNQFVPASANAPTAYTVRNPATQDVLATVPETSTDDFNVMISKAQVAFEEWRTVPVQQRQRVMGVLQHLIRQHTEQLAACITAENGKTLTDARGDVFRGLEVVETAAANVATYMQGDSLRGLAAGVDCISYRRPLGVTAGLCPFNFPAMIPMWMFPLAVTAGNCMVLKPSEKTPATTCLLAQLAVEAGLPPNVLQIVHGSVPTVQNICRHPAVRAISFVGSNAAGEWIANEGVQHGKRVQANLGAKNHAVILPDAADPNAVVRAVAGAAFGE